MFCEREKSEPVDRGGEREREREREMGGSCWRRSGPGRGGLCTLRYWKGRVRNSIKKSCVSDKEQPSAQDSCQLQYADANNEEQRPSAHATGASLHADITNDAKDQTLPEIRDLHSLLAKITLPKLDTLIARLEAEVQLLSPSTSASSSLFHDTISHWEEHSQSLTTFMKSLPNQVLKEAVDPVRDLLNNLLIRGLGGIGQVHWMGLGLSFLAWSLENINRTSENYEEGLEVLRQSVSLLKHTKQIWAHIGAHDESTSYEGDLQKTVETAFRCAIICTSNLNDNRILRFLRAPNVEQGLIILKQDLDRANNQNMELMLRYKLCDTSELEHQVVYTNIEDKERVGDVKVADKAMTYLRKDCNDIIAVWLHGMGGIGKSFIAQQIFTQIQNSNCLQQGIHYKDCRVELEFGKKLGNHIEIQRQILGKVSVHKPAFSNTFDGRQILQDNLQKIKEPIFLYLDNIMEFGDLEEILPKVSCFPTKSRILVTSRDTVTQAEIEKLGIKECKLIEVKSLQENLARELLWKQITSIENHKDHVIDDSCKKLEEEVLKLCGGLPLALEVVGGYIASDPNGPKDARVWKYVVDSMQHAQGLKVNKEDKLFYRLKFSIENLDDKPKKAFLDMVSFYDVGDSWTSLKSLVGYGFMKAFKERALVQKLQKTSTEQQSIGKIHDLLRAIGKKMIEEDINELHIAGKEEFDNLKEHNIEKVVTLKEVKLEASMLKRMPLLRFLKAVEVKGNCSDAQLRHLAVVRDMTSKAGNPLNFRQCASLKEVTWSFGGVNDLEVLRHEKICKGLETLRLTWWPKLENVDAIETFGCLRELVIEYRFCSPNNIQCLPEGIENLTNLRELRLECLEFLERLPEGISGLTCLKRLSLRGCGQLQSVPRGISMLQSLKVLQLGLCRCLRSLPEGIGNLTALTQLNLENCTNLQVLPEGVGALTGLTELNLTWCSSLQALPQGILCCLTGLTSLQMDHCLQLQSLPEDITRLNNLKIVSVSDCKSLVSLPKGFVGLQELRMDGCYSIESIAEELACLKCLSKLRFSYPRDHNLLPQEISALTCNLTELHLVGCDTLQRIDGIATLDRLTHLKLLSCSTLQSIEGITALVCLRDLILEECNSLQQLPQGVSRLTNLTSLEVHSCANFRSIPEEIASLRSLRELEFHSCQSLESLPQGIGSLEGLRKLYVNQCRSMQQALPEVTRLLGLRYLHLSGCKNLERLPDGLSKLSGLMELNLFSCVSLQCLPPEGLSSLTGLTELHLGSCKSLQCLPAGIGRLKGLHSLKFNDCENLKSLPQEIASLTQVQSLNLTDCSALQALPGGVAGMRGLRNMELRNCTSLESLPQGITSLSGLESLDLSGCTSLKFLPQGISNLVGLKFLSLHRCPILEPQITLEEIYCLSCLESLNFVGMKKLQVVPAQGLASMTSLEYLSLSDCTSLLSLPEELANLKYLEHLYLVDCENLKSLPQGISSLTHLETLDLRGCKSLFSLPEGVTKLAVNCYIYLDGCPASMPL